MLCAVSRGATAAQHAQRLNLRRPLYCTYCLTIVSKTSRQTIHGGHHLMLFGPAEGQPLRRSMSGGSSLAAAAAEDELALLRIDADNTLLLDALERRAPRSVRNTVSYLEVRSGTGSFVLERSYSVSV
jgi:hypothetical protein